MAAIHNYSAFVSAVFLFQLSPGPGTFAILSASARGGGRAGMSAVAGILAGDLMYMLAAVTGLSALLAASPVVFEVMRWAGIACLCRIGWNLLKSAPDVNLRPDTPDPAARSFFRQALLIGLSNPKAIMFFMVFFPLFMDLPAPPQALAIMIAHVFLISLVWQTCLVLAGYGVSRRLSRMKRSRLIFRRLTGGAFIGFGIKLAFKP